MKPSLCLAALALLALPALAESPLPATDTSGTVSVKPGLWNWSHATELAGFPFTETNTECLPPKNAKISLTDVADALDQNCTVSSVRPVENGYNFSLSCSGEISGRALGRLTRVSDTEVAMDASGMASLAGMEAPFTFRATAKHVGACPG